MQLHVLLLVYLLLQTCATQTYSNNSWSGLVLVNICLFLATDALGNLYGPIYYQCTINRWLALSAFTTSAQTIWYSSTPA